MELEWPLVELLEFCKKFIVSESGILFGVLLLRESEKFSFEWEVMWRKTH